LAIDAQELVGKPLLSKEQKAMSTINIEVKDDTGAILMSKHLEMANDSILIRNRNTGSVIKKIRDPYFYGSIDLRHENLTNADLRSPHLDWDRVALRGAQISGALLPAPTKLLLAHWGTLSGSTTTALMRLDASAHPDPEAFNRWGQGGPCPYEGGARFERVVRFNENKAFWSPGPPPTIFEALTMILDEACPDWNE
jgi:hypothetical protein